eukprot:SAG31_NODE_1045_length_10180_cov_5.454221_8_plen_93_part_00
MCLLPEDNPHTLGTGTGAYKNGKFERIKMSSRTSHNAWLMNGLEHDPWVRQVDRKIANATGLYHGNSGAPAGPHDVPKSPDMTSVFLLRVLF